MLEISDLGRRGIVLTKALISFAVTAKLICVFVFAFAKSRFSPDEAHVTNKEVGNKIQDAIDKHDDLFSIVKKRKLRR